MSKCPKKTHLHLSSVLNSDTQNELEGEEALSTSRPPAEGAEGEEDRGGKSPCLPRAWKERSDDATNQTALHWRRQKAYHFTGCRTAGKTRRSAHW